MVRVFEIIVRILKALYLYPVAKVVYRWIRDLGFKITNRKRAKAFYTAFDDFFVQIRQSPADPGGIVAVGILCTPHKPTLMPFLSRLQQLRQKQIVLLDEAKDSDIHSPFLRLRIPRSAPVKYDRNLELTVTEEMEQLIQQKDFLRHAVENMTLRISNMTVSYAKVLACKSYEMYQTALDTWKPSEVMIWSEYNVLHTICAAVCREKGIDPVFMEFGVLPGTFAIERGGQMGKSKVAQNPEEFLALPVTEEELEKSREVIAFLRSSGLNRNVQPQNDEMERLQQQLKPGRPIVLFAGQHDFDSGMVPYTEETREYHSPMFTSSQDAANHLAKIAKKNDWTLVFKPHPGMLHRYRREELAENIIFVSNVNLNDLIDQVDVVVTLMSQTAYVSLIREKAVLTLGFNQLRGKGCTYEAYTDAAIEQALLDAIEHGYTAEQKQNFIRHSAQLLKYYLYDDMKARPLRYGQRL